MRPPRVLIIDDEVEFASLLAMILGEEGYQTLVAYDGAAGLRLAKEAQPDVVIVDAVMPVIDGYEVCRQLRANEATVHLPLLMLTGRTLDSELEEARRAGAHACLTKPCEPDQLLQTVSSLVARRASTDAAARDA
jgi:DNA-binding response OmpR family regulator